MSKSLMIVDDSATMRKIIMRTVRMSGLEFERTEEAGNGVEALEKLSSAPVDVILCDINMPEMGGPEVIDGLIADGANGYITKPFTPEKFQEKLSPLLN